MSKQTFEQKKTFALNSLKRAGLVAVGCIGGKFLNNFIARKTVGTSGEEEDLLGLSPKVSKWVTPSLVAGVGVATALTIKNAAVKDAALGLMAAGMVSLVQSATKKDLSTLNGDTDEDDAPVPIAGIDGYRSLPGVGDVSYGELPSENDYVNDFASQPLPNEGNMGEMGDLGFMAGEPAVAQQVLM
ncbi:MAG: hypothetical protein IJ911_09735 [Salinivirgaceae bacterium]|nr:hypothetical protein [Salinivirgaceae bacterium]